MNVEELKSKIQGDVLDDLTTLDKYSRDASLFEVKPETVVFPKNVHDVSEIVKFVSEKKRSGENLYITARSGGTDMTGGSLGESIILAFEKYFNHVELRGDLVVTEPGVFYRDFERETLKHGLIMPSFPASREICALGGMVNNNAGGEKTLKYGKTEKYVEELKVILSDGQEYVFRKLNRAELAVKLVLKTYEGEIYRKINKLVVENGDLLASAKPKVTKNSAGYGLWNIWDKKTQTFDLTQLFVGSQGTLGLLVEATLRLVKVKKHSELLVVFLKDLEPLAKIVETVLPYGPESFESYDDNTFKLAVKYFYSFAKLMGTGNMLSLGFKFLPEMMMLLSGVPKLVLLIEFADDDQDVLDKKIEELKKSLSLFNLKMRVARSESDINKYHLMRRESFNLLRQRVKDKHTAPFIDDVVVRHEQLPEFLPQLKAILDTYNILYTLAGHVGDGNFHVIPLMNLKDEKERAIIPELSRKVYDLVFKFGGSTTAEHNDGLIRSPYLKEMFGEKVYSLFEEVKHIFDPLNIFNPGKKVGSSMEFALEHIRKD